MYLKFTPFKIRHVAGETLETPAALQLAQLLIAQIKIIFVKVSTTITALV